VSLELDGSDDRRVFDVPAALQSYTFGTWLILVRQLDDGSWSGWLNLHNNLTTSRAGLEKGDTSNDNRVNLVHGGNARKNPDAITASDGWLLIVVGKATGTATPTWSIRTAGTGGTWTHGNMDGTLANATLTSNRMVVGMWEQTDFANMRVAAMAVWQGTTLNNTQRESIWPAGAGGSVDNILALTPTWCVQYNLANPTDQILDLTGNGGNERAADRVGGTVSADEPPGWTYAGGATDLDPDDAAHNHTVEQPTLTQAHQLATADTDHGHTAGQPTLTQIHTLTVDAATHAHTATAAAVTQVHALAVDAATHGHTAGLPTLTQAHDVAVADAGHAHTATAAALTQAHALIAADAAHGHTASSPTLAAAGDLAVNDATHSHTAGQPALTQAHTLDAADAAHGHTAGQPALHTSSTLAADGASHAQAATTPTLTQTHLLAVAPALHAHLADVAALTQLHLLAPNNTIHAHTATSPPVGEPGVAVGAGSHVTTGSTTAAVRTGSTTGKVAIL
jgi:hypothetical protein